MNVWEKIKKSKKTSVTYEIIANKILDTKNLKDLSISVLCRKTNCSPATIVRFSQSLGFEGFKELKYNLISFINYHDQKLEDDVFEENDKLRYISSVLQQTELQNIPLIAKKIQNADFIYIISRGDSQIFSDLLLIQLQQLGLRAFNASNIDSEKYVLNTMPNNSLLIFISLAGETQELISIIRKYNDQYDDVLITANKNSNMTRIIKDVIFFKNSEFQINYSLTSRFSLLYVIENIALEIMKLNVHKYKTKLNENMWK